MSPFRSAVDCTGVAHTSITAGSTCSDRDIRPNRLLRTQIVEYRERTGLPKLPEWQPDPVESVASILPGEGNGGNAAGGLPMGRGGHPHGQVNFPIGGPHPSGQQLQAFDAFGVPPTSQEATVKLVEAVLTRVPFLAATVELALGQPAGSAAANRALVAQQSVQQPRVLQMLMQVRLLQISPHHRNPPTSPHCHFSVSKVSSPVSRSLASWALCST